MLRYMVQTVPSSSMTMLIPWKRRKKKKKEDLNVFGANSVPSTVLFLWEGKNSTCVGSSGTANKLYAKHLHVVSVKEMNSKVHQSKSGFSSLILFIQTKLKQIWQLENTDK